MYLSAMHGAISAVLMTEWGTAQTPVYFISRALQGPELNYSPMEKLVLSLVFAAKRLRRYFQAHQIAVITDQPIKQVMSRLDVAGRLQKWSIMLGEHNITYRPRTSIKGQILADFLNEMPSNASQDGSGAWLILTNPDRVEFTYALRFQFAASNNEAEYEALIADLRIAMQMGVKNIQANVDSKLVANQVLGAYVAKEDNMIKYLEITKGLDMIRKCSDCQIHRPITRHPQQPLTPITAPWPFYKWGIDIAGPFSEGPGKVKFLIVAMDYFTKWIEAKAMATITREQVKKFVWDNIVCRFGIPGEIISDNVERANRSIGEGIKARLGEENKNWVEELPHVLWAHRTMIKSSHVIPAEIEMPTYRTTVVDVVNNDEELRLNLDLLEERRELTAMSEARSK
nr:reverse transcriptase domain-containing protein [Tanacetum cinerariifolium]